MRGLRVAVFACALLFAQWAQAQQVVLQGYWWDYWNSSYPNGWSNYLADLAPRLKAMNINAVWIPPTIKNGNQGNGYSPFDGYDLGDKYQKGFTKTRMGNKDELLRMVGILHANGINVVQDVVLNHVDNAGSATGQGGQDASAWDDYVTSKYKNFRYVSYNTPASAETSANYLARSGRFPKNWQNFYPNPANSSTSGNWNQILFGPDIAYDAGSYGQSGNATYNPTQTTNYMRDNTRSWLVWYKKQLGFDGVRLDAVKHFPDWAMEDFLYNLQFNAGWASGGNTMLAVGEYVGGSGELDSWCNAVQNRAGTFDFSLRDGIYQMVSQGGAFNIGTIPGFQQGNRVQNYSGTYVHRTCTFVNNHDTFRPQLDANGNYIGWNTGSELAPHIDPFDGRLSAAYAIAFAVDGNPVVFFEDLFNVSASNRFTHSPTNATQLPVRDDIVNLIWCHQNLRFKDGAYKVRWQAADHLVIERSTKAVIGINDSWSTWQNNTVQTDFAQGTVLKDYSGANGTATVTVGAGGWVAINTPPCNGTAAQGRRGYSVWAPVNAATSYTQPERTTTQEWEMANDLGDSHASSLGQGGALPASSTAQRYVGKIFVQSGKAVTYNLYPSDATRSLAIKLYNGTTLLTSKTGTGTLTGTYTPTYTGWLTIKVNNNSTANPAQNVWVKMTYTSPQSVSTASYPASLQGSDLGEVNNGEIADGTTAADPAVAVSTTLTLIPNPATRDDVGLSIIHPAEISATVVVSDLEGRAIHTQSVTVYPGSNEIHLRLPETTAAGLYLVSVPELKLQQKLTLH